MTHRHCSIFPGFQAAHTLGRKIADGARKITLFHEEHHVRAEVVQLHGFSGHADQYELRAQLGVVREHAQRVFLVHGEAEQSKALADELRNDGFARVDIVQPGERAEL